MVHSHSLVSLPGYQSLKWMSLKIYPSSLYLSRAEQWQHTDITRQGKPQKKETPNKGHLPIRDTMVLPHTNTSVLNYYLRMGDTSQFTSCPLSRGCTTNTWGVLEHSVGKLPPESLGYDGGRVVAGRLTVLPVLSSHRSPSWRPGHWEKQPLTLANTPQECYAYYLNVTSLARGKVPPREPYIVATFTNWQEV